MVKLRYMLKWLVVSTAILVIVGSVATTKYEHLADRNFEPATSLGTLCASHTAFELVEILGMTELSKRQRGSTSKIFMNTDRGLVLKKVIKYNEFNLFSREACVISLLASFEWSPKLICAGEDYLLMTYVGRTVCKEEGQQTNEYLQQLNGIFADLKSVGVKHNDLAKNNLKEVMILDGKMSIVDYGWATVNGKLDVQCELNGLKLSSSAERTYNPKIDRGFALEETAQNVLPYLQKCESNKQGSFTVYLNKGRKGFGSQKETPTVTVDNQGQISVSGYHTYSVSKTGKLSISKKEAKYKKVAVLLRRLYVAGCRSFIDVGANTGIVSFLAKSEGFKPIVALDHDAPALDVVKQVAKYSGLSSEPGDFMAKVFNFGADFPMKADIVYMGSLIHWVWCLTADFQGDFEHIMEYVFTYTAEFLVLEFVKPEDVAIKSFGHLTRCTGPKPKLPYTTTNFEAAVRKTGGKIVETQTLERNRVAYVISVPGAQFNLIK
ncbi:unnamed protein product [Bathycoccus prasinos]